MHCSRAAALAGLVITVAVLAPAVAGQPALKKPATLAFANGPITALAQDRARIAWAAVENCIAVVRVGTLARGGQSVGTADTPSCESDQRLGGLGAMHLALAGDRALWSYEDYGTNVYALLKTGSISGARNRAVGEPLVYSATYGTGDHLTALAGDGATLAYSFVRLDFYRGLDCGLDEACPLVVSGGGARRVTGTKSVAVPDTPAVVAIALGLGRIALVQVTVSGLKPAPTPNSAVQIRDALTGALVTSFAPAGTVRAVALGRNVAAVLVTGAAGTRIERYSIPAGALLASTAVPAATGPELSTNDSVVVFYAGLSVSSVPVGPGALSVLALAKATPVGLSVEGRRVIWAENQPSGNAVKGRIQAINL